MRAVAAETVTRPRYGLGFATLDSEVQIDSLVIEGHVPRWLSGTLLRNGPGKFEAGDQQLRHWFDGLAMLHRFSFSEGAVSYANRFLRTEAYSAAERGDISFSEFATDPSRSLLKRAATMLRPQFSDNCSFHVARLGNDYIALTETPVRVAFDPESLETRGLVSSLAGHHVTAHPHRDAGSDELLSLATKYGRRSRYRVLAEKDRRRHRIVAELPAGEPSYMHSFGLTERHIVLTACPFVVNPLQLGLSGRPFIENFRWEPERGVRFFVIDRHSGRLRGTYEADTFFAFHHVNVFEVGAELCIDLIAYESPDVIGALYLDKLRAEPPAQAVHGRFTRHRIDLDRGRVLPEELCGEMFELPQIHYRRCNGRRYRFVYGASVDSDTGGEPSDFLDQIIKVDVETGETKFWREPASYPGEPTFVPAPGNGDAGRESGGGSAEDDGVLLSIVLDTRDTGSYLLVLDAGSLEELGRARLPHHIPFSFHGEYFG